MLERKVTQRSGREPRTNEEIGLGKGLDGFRGSQREDNECRRSELRRRYGYCRTEKRSSMLVSKLAFGSSGSAATLVTRRLLDNIYVESRS